MPRQEPYTAPYQLSPPTGNTLPEGTFLLPVCTTRERLLLMQNALIKGGLEIGLRLLDDHNIDFYEALVFVGQPEMVSCWDVPVEPTPPVPPPADGGDDGKGKRKSGIAGRLPDCVEILDCDGDGIAETINVREDCEESCMVQINVYEGCGCGSGDVGSGSKSIATGTGITGTDDTSFVGEGVGGSVGIDKCDVASYMLPYALAQGREFFEEMKNFADNGGNIVDFFEEAADFIDPVDVTPAIVSGIKSVIEQSANAIEQVIDFFEDTDFLLVYQEKWWQRTSELVLFEGRVDTITRADLKYGIRYLPLTWGQVLDGVIVIPRIMLDLFFSVINEKKLQRRLVLAEDQANATLCNYLAAQIGQTYTPPVSPGSVLAPPSTGTNGELSQNFQSAAGTDYVIELWELNEPYRHSTAPTSLPATYDNRTLVAGGVKCINTNTLSGLNNDNIYRMTDSGVNPIYTATMSIGNTAFEGYDFVDGEFAAQDRSDILDIITGMYAAFAGTEQGTATSRAMPSGGRVDYGSTRGAQPVGTCEITYLWFVHRAT